MMTSMTRSELAQALSKLFPDLALAQIEKTISIIFDEILETLSQGGRVELRGFGVFETRHRKARTGRNPRTGESVHIPSKSIPFFRTGKQLNKKLNSQ